MPDVKPGESQNDYMSRCVPMVKDEGATQEQAVGKCLGMYKNATESNVLGRINTILCEAVVVGTVGKSMEQKICPRNQVWCPKCNACVDRQERTGMGVPVPENFNCPECKKTEFTWEEDASWKNTVKDKSNADLSNVLTFIFDLDKDKWNKINIKNLKKLEKKMGGKMPAPEIHALKLQTDKKKVKKLWFYLDPYDEFINSKWTIRWAFSQKEADDEILDSLKAAGEKQPWGEKSFGRVKTL